MNVMTPRTSYRTRSIVTPLLLCSAFLVGCGGESEGPAVELSGRVTLDGEPLSLGSIQFTSLKTGASFPANLNLDGTYEVTILDTQPGDTYGVSFGPVVRPEDAPVILDAEGNPKGDPIPPVPPKYLEYTKSGLTVDLEEVEGRPVDFELKSNPA